MLEAAKNTIRSVMRPSVFRGPFKNYEEAARQCIRHTYADQGTGQIMSQEDTAKLERIRNGNIRPQDMTAALLYKAVLGESVLDFGGGYGEKYEILKQVYPEFDPLYDIVELPEKVQSALGASDKKRYFAGLDGLRPHYSHLVMGAVLQTLPNPEKTFFDVLDKVRSDYLYITALPIEKSGLILIKRQKNHGEFPYYIFGGEWLDILNKAGKIILKHASVRAPIIFNGRPIYCHDFLIERG
jgi:putative methyltransferase (TIGR04325 family)